MEPKYEPDADYSVDATEVQNPEDSLDSLEENITKKVCLVFGVNNLNLQPTKSVPIIRLRVLAEIQGVGIQTMEHVTVAIGKKFEQKRGFPMKLYFERKSNYTVQIFQLFENSIPQIIAETKSFRINQQDSSTKIKEKLFDTNGVILPDTVVSHI